MSAEIFKFGEQSLRVTMVDGEPHFFAADAARALGIAQVASTLRDFPSDEKGMHATHTPGGVQKVTILNEPGLYRLIFQSRKAEAERFKKWVFTEVLPAIRREGRYSLPGVEGEVMRMRAVLDEAIRAVVAGTMALEKGTVVAKLAAQWVKTLPREWQHGLALPAPQVSAAQWEALAAAVVDRAAAVADWATVRRDAAGRLREVRVRTGQLLDVAEAGSLLPGVLSGDYGQRAGRLGSLLRSGMAGRTLTLPDGGVWRVKGWRAKAARGWAFTRIS